MPEPKPYRERAEIGGRRRDVQRLRPDGANRANDRLLEPPGTLRLDQLSAVRPQQSLGDSRHAHGPQPAQSS